MKSNQYIKTIYQSKIFIWLTKTERPTGRITLMKIVGGFTITSSDSTRTQTWKNRDIDDLKNIFKKPNLI